MQFRNVSKRQKILLVITCVFLGGVIFNAAFLRPFRLKKMLLSKQLEDSTNKLAKMRMDLKIKDKIESSYKKVSELFQGSDKKTQEISTFTREISSIYSQHDLKIRSVNILPDEKKTNYKKLFLKIEMIGAVKSMFSFIKGVTEQESPLKIETLHMKAAEVSGHVRAEMIISKLTSV